MRTLRLTAQKLQRELVEQGALDALREAARMSNARNPIRPARQFHIERLLEESRVPGGAY